MKGEKDKAAAKKDKEKADGAKAPEKAEDAEKKEATAAPPKAALMEKLDSINEKGYDWSVYQFTNDNISGWRDGVTPDDAYPNNGWKADPWSLAQRSSKDIGDKNIDEEVVGFVRADKNMMPIP